MSLAWGHVVLVHFEEGDELQEALADEVALLVLGERREQIAVEVDQGLDLAEQRLRVLGLDELALLERLVIELVHEAQVVDLVATSGCLLCLVGGPVESHQQHT